MKLLMTYINFYHKYNNIKNVGIVSKKYLNNKCLKNLKIPLLTTGEIVKKWILANQKTAVNRPF